MWKKFAQLSSECCEQAYYAKPAVEKFLPKGASYKQFNVPKNGMSVTIYEMNLAPLGESPLGESQPRNTYIVAFRGTDQGVDWVTNLSMIKQVVDMPEGLCETTKSEVRSSVPWYCYYTTPRLHAGFYSGFSSLSGFIKSYFEEKNSEKLLNGSRIILTGHSLGGALSTVCAYELYHYKQKYNVDLSVLTFGAPRVCNLYASILLKVMYKDRAIRIVNGMDPVTLTPLTNSWHCFPLVNLYEKTYWQCFKGLLCVLCTSTEIAASYTSNIMNLMK